MAYMRGILGVIAAAVLAGCGVNSQERQMQEFIRAHVAQVRPVQIEAETAAWDAACSGKADDYRRAADLRLKVNTIYANRREFGFLKQMIESGQVKDAILARQLDVLYRAYRGNQIDEALLKEIVDLGAKVEEGFSTFRGTIDGRRVTENEIKEVLKREIDVQKRRKAWLASKQVGPVVGPDVIALVRLRNKAARSVGFDNFHTMSLELSDQKVADVQRVFKELYDLTEGPFGKLKADLDARLAARYGVKVDELRPWHYHDPFFQEGPVSEEAGFDVYYKGRDIVQLGSRFYAGIGLPVEDVLAASDLFEREGKNPHAFCTDIDRAGDVRVLCNIKDNESWMETTLHELGHAVYAKYYGPDVPYLLRGPVHPFTTEAIAMFFGRLSRDPGWMQAMLGLSDGQCKDLAGPAAEQMRQRQLIFARWAMVMFEFERRMYADPEQDLNSLWWELVAKYQHIRRPDGRNEPDWAAKIHIATSPCYYHNYLLGELLASQLDHYAKANTVTAAQRQGGYVGSKELGRYLREQVFEPGAVYPWNEMISRATGEGLTAQYFVEQFVK